MTPRRKKYYGNQTELALKHFAIGSEKWPREMVRAQTLVKKAAALANNAVGALDSVRAKAIVSACNEVLSGSFDDQFPLSIWQSGSGTQFNMNVNEVIASRANEILTGKINPKTPVHPNDHVNMSQSTNDTVPTSTHVAVLSLLREHVYPSMDTLEATLKKKSRAFKGIQKIGRTHLQDAVTLTLGDEFSGYATQVHFLREHLTSSARTLLEVPLGGTAIGTGLNASKGFTAKAIKELSKLAGFAFIPARNSFVANATHDRLLLVSSSLKVCAVSLSKIANDIRLMGSGPHAGIGELLLPQNEPGSSIMPGKVNPTQCEALMMVSAQIIGMDSANAQAALMLSNFELAGAKPIIAFNLITSLLLLGDALHSFEEFCIRGIEPNRKRIEENLKHSLQNVTEHSSKIGYDKSL